MLTISGFILVSVGVQLDITLEQGQAKEEEDAEREQPWRHPHLRGHTPRQDPMRVEAREDENVQKELLLEQERIGKRPDQIGDQHDGRRERNEPIDPADGQQRHYDRNAPSVRDDEPPSCERTQSFDRVTCIRVEVEDVVDEVPPPRQRDRIRRR